MLLCFDVIKFTLQVIDLHVRRFQHVLGVVALRLRGIALLFRQLEFLHQALNRGGVRCVVHLRVAQLLGKCVDVVLRCQEVALGRCKVRSGLIPLRSRGSQVRTQLRQV